MTAPPLRAGWMPHYPASCWADADTSGSKPLLLALYSTLLEAKDLDHILAILGRILTNMVKAGPLCAAAEDGCQYTTLPSPASLLEMPQD